MTPELYKTYRDRLVLLLESATGLQGLLPQSREHISEARTRLLEDQFEIVLVGEFQGGKSTTFNIFCGGREVSPRGIGIKTSGCIVRAVPISDPSKHESATITWRSNDELFLGIQDILSPSFLPSSMEDSQSEDNLENFRDIYNLSTPAGRKALSQRANHLAEVWKKNKAAFSPEDTDAIRFALLYSHFCGSADIENLKNLTAIPLGAVREYVTFPEDWISRWLDCSAERFTPKEIAFAFVKQVDCRIKSPALSKIGTALVDCPGMFASVWDTNVAEKAIANANAVLYLIPGFHTISEADLHKFENLINVLKLAPDNIFLAPNCWQKSWKDIETRILPETLATLASKDLVFPEARIQMFSPLPALRAEQIRMFINHKVDLETLAELKKQFFSDDDPSIISEETLLAEIIRSVERGIEDLQGKSFAFQNIAALADSAEKESRICILTSALEAFVVSRRAKNILTVNASRVKDALSETEGTLLYREDSASKKRHDCENEFKRADEELVTYEADAAEKLSKFGQDAAQALGHSLKEHLSAKQDACIKKLSDAMGKHVVKTAFSLTTNKDETLKRLNRTSSAIISEWQTDEIRKWINGCQTGKNIIYNATIKQNIQETIDSIQRYWSVVKNKKIPILAQIEIANVKSLRERSVLEQQQFTQKIVAGIKVIADANFWNTILLTTTVATLLIVALTPLTWPALIVILPIVAYIIFGANVPIGEMLDLRNIFNTKEKIRIRLQKSFDDQAETIAKAATKALEDYISETKATIEHDLIEHPRRIFELKMAQTKADFNLAEADRFQLADEARAAQFLFCKS